MSDRYGSATRRSIDTSVPVVVMTAVLDPVLHGALGVIRTLGRLGVPVYAVHAGRGGPITFSRYLRQSFTARLEPASPEKFADALVEIGRRLGRRAVLIPMDDIGALFVDEWSHMLREHFLFPYRPQGLARLLSNKRELYLLCERMRIPAPQSAFPRSRSELGGYIQNARFPIVVKAVDPMRLQLPGSARSVQIAATPAELIELYERTPSFSESNLMLQEYIAGGADTIWMFNAYLNEHSDCLIAFTGTKLRQYLPYTGATSLGICRDNHIIQEMTRRLLKEVGYRGIVDMGYRYDARDGQYKLLDVNPRIGGTFRLFVAMNGMDVARAMYLDMTGQNVPQSPARDGRKWIVENDDVRTSRLYHRDGKLSFAEWARSLRNVEEGAWFAWDDLVPFINLCLRSVLGMSRRGLQRSIGRVGQTLYIRQVRPIAGQKRDGSRRPQLPAGTRTASRSNGGAHGETKLTVRWASTYFEEQASFWRDVYRDDSLYGVIYRHREALALAWVHKLGLLADSCVLEVGAGAGRMSVLLARRDFRVQAMDISAAMLKLTRRHAVEAGVRSRLSLSIGDVHALAFKDNTFSLVVALGVIPWVHDPEQALREMARSLQPGGYLIVSADNRHRLNHLVDPLYNPALRSIRRVGGQLFDKMRWRRPAAKGGPVRMHDLRTFDRFIRAIGLEPISTMTFGFGPISLMGREVLPRAIGIKVNHALQRLADSGLPGIRSAGSQYFVIARKPPT